MSGATTSTTTSPVALVEKAMLAHLLAVQRDYPTPEVQSYAAQLDDATYAWARVLPAIWVTFAGQTSYTQKTNHTFRAKVKFEVLVAQRDLSENDARLNAADAGQAVGVYQLLEDNKRALVNSDLGGLAIKPFVPGAIRPVMKSLVNRDAVAVYAQEFETEWVEVFQDAPVTPDGVLQTIGMGFYLKPQHSAPADPEDKSQVITTRIPT